MVDEKVWQDVRFIESNKLMKMADEGVDYIDTRSGEVVKGYVSRKSSHDAKPFLKYFMGSSALFGGLSSGAKTTLFIVLHQLEESKESTKVFLNDNALSDFIKATQKHNPDFKFTKSSMFRGANELIEKGVLFRVGSGVYHINPNLAFNGDRVRGFKKAMKK